MSYGETKPLSLCAFIRCWEKLVVINSRGNDYPRASIHQQAVRAEREIEISKKHSMKGDNHLIWLTKRKCPEPPGPF